MNDQLPGHDYRTPVDPKLKETLNELARDLHSHLPVGWGFTILLFKFGEGGDLLYISNAQRADMVKTMQEFIAKQANA